MLRQIKFLFIMFFVSLLLSIPKILFPQEIEEEVSTFINRTQYFSFQRKFPTDSIPMNAFQDMIQGKDNLRQQNGLYMNASNSWITVGPKPGYYSGLSSGRGVFVAIDPTRPQGGMTVYYGADNGGLWKSTNAFTANPFDVVWTNITTDLHPDMPSPSGAIAIDINEGETYPIIYYGTGTVHDFGVNVIGDGIYKTENDGVTWTKGTGLPAAAKVMKIAIDPFNSSHLLAALANQWFLYGKTDCGLYISNNAGVSWQRVAGTENLYCCDVQFSPSVRNQVFLSGPKPTEPPPPNGLLTGPGPGYKMSVDGGVNWFSPLNNGIYIYSITVMSICKSSPNVMYGFTYGDSSGVNINRIYKSTDYGYTFNLLPYVNNYCYPSFDQWVEVSPTNPDLVYFAGKDLYRSTNGGTSFYDVNSMHDDKHGLVFYPTTNPNDPNVNKMLFTCDGGIWRTFDGSAGITIPDYDNLNNTLNCIEFYRGGADPYKLTNLLGSSEDNGLQHRTSESLQWTLASQGGDEANNCFNSKKSGNFIHMRCDNQPPIYLWASFNGGYNETPSNFYSTYSDNTSWVMPMVHDPDILGSNPYGNFFTAKKEVWKSVNGGTYFAVISPSLDPYVPHNHPIEQLAVSQSNPNYIYAGLWTSPDQNWPPSFEQWLVRTSDGGDNWVDWRHKVSELGLPNKYITNIQVDPVLNNEVFITMSGFWGVGNFNGEHVFKSTNFGQSWSALAGLDFCPVNDLLINYKDANTRQFFAATDIGVYVYDESINHWNQLGENLPNVTCGNLQLNKFSQKLRVFTTGRGCWEYDLASLSQDPKIYVKDYLYLTSYGTTDPDGLNIDYDIVVCSGGHVVISNPCLLKFAAGKKLIVESGGILDASYGSSATLTSQSGTWGGIEFNGTGSGTFDGCTFQNTSTPVTINQCLVESPPITFDHCDFGGGTILINSRSNVTIQNSNFQTGFGFESIASSNSSNLNIYHNTINPSGYHANTCISITYGDNVTIIDNTISNFDPCISVSNSNAYLEGNALNSDYPASTSTGISLSYAYSASLKENTIEGYQTAISMFNSSPTLKHNIISNTSYSNPLGINCTSNSFPRLRPLYDVPYIYWDAGNNFFFESQNLNSTRIFDIDYGLPVVSYGYNKFYGSDYYIKGEYSPGGEYTWHCEYNCWYEDPPLAIKFQIDEGAAIYFDPTSCDDPSGGGEEEDINITAEPALFVPQPLIVDRGNGIFDTINVTSGSQTLSADKLLYFSAYKNELMTNYSSAVSQFQQVIQDYQDSLTAIYSLKQILACKDKMNSDTAAYSNLRNYYNGLAQANSSDTVFSNVASELATKCLIRIKQIPTGITEYENVIANTTDSLKILGCEINIIEAYMLITSGGDAPEFTGKIKELKPKSIQDGIRMIRERLIGKSKNEKQNLIPKQFSLSQNYPNPFNPLTKINYSLPQGVKVSIKIYDILGKLVKELVNEYKDAGTYTVTFDGSNVASGVYFYKIEAGKFTDTKKMVLIK